MLEEECEHKDVQRCKQIGWVIIPDASGDVTRCRDCRKSWHKRDDYKHIPDRADPPWVGWVGLGIAILFFLFIYVIASNLDHSYTTF